MFNLKSQEDIQKMRTGGKIAAKVMQELIAKADAETTTLALDKLAEELIKKFGGEPSFKKVLGYHHTLCTTVNDQVVHGLPGNYTLKNGDLLGIDLGVYYQGFHTDTSTSFIIGSYDGQEKRRFLEAGQRALKKAIEKARVGNHVGDISYAIQKEVERAGYSVVRELVGHGVGRELHEDLRIPGRGRPGTGPKILEGMTLAIEVIYNKGSHQVMVLPDGWTIVTSDGEISGLFEHTVAVTSQGPVVLTSG
ncbi:MAG: type I methionyl aminopeptidase [Patescibacteria group bacterium]|nr:type I methionyl aminopeptidase [Patescibacteria group bacterium]